MHKAAEESLEHGITVVCLVPCRSDTQWWNRTVMDYEANVVLVEGRLKFGDSPNSAPFPSAVVIFSPLSCGGFSTMKNKER